jgi:hypothetical protein
VTPTHATSSEWRRLGRAGPTPGEMELLRAATLPVDAAGAAWHRWLAGNDIDLAHHRSTDLLPAVSANLPGHVIGNEADRLRGIRRRLWADNQLGLLTLAHAVELLRPHSIEPTVAKGAALVTTVYRDPGTRAMADVDLVVPPESFVPARLILEAAGWRQTDPVEGPFFHAVAMADEQGRSVDVHKWIVFPRFTSVPERSWRERSVPHTIGRSALLRLSSPDELVLTTLHGLLTNSSSSSRWPLDVVQLSRVAAADDPGFWDTVMASANELRVGAVVADALDMCRAELDAPVPGEVLSRLRSAPVDRGLAQHWWLCRRGITPEWRIRRYRRLERSEGRRPTVRGYVAPRFRAIRTRGLGTVMSVRMARVRQIVTDRTRD